MNDQLYRRDSASRQEQNHSSCEADCEAAGSAQPRAQHIVNISGGKDSAACALLAAERGRHFRLVMADTGNEAPVTVEYAHQVAAFVGRPLEIVRADFSDKLAAKRAMVEAEWLAKGVPADRVARALEILHPTGNPFLDLCIWKGRFPSRKAQFCTDFLKSRAIEDGIVRPALEAGPVVQWLGVRRDESLNRRDAPVLQRVRRADAAHDIVFYRPIATWTAADVFAHLARRGLPPNPLYLQGMGRVGCFPCINAGKAELAEIGRRFPEAVEKLMAWEALVKDASKRGAATFFASDVTPEGAALGKRLKRQARAWVLRHHPDIPETTEDGKPSPAFAARLTARMAEISAGAPWPRADEVFTWARTDRGGRQFSLIEKIEADAGLSCSSQYGLCE